MELSSFFRTEPLDFATVVETLRSVCGPEALDPRDTLSIAVVGPWRPCDRWRHGPERLMWSARFLPAGGFRLSDLGRARLWSGALSRRHAPFDPAEIVAARLGSGLVVEASDDGEFGYYALYRAGVLARSRLLRDREALIHCDRRQVTVLTPPDLPPEDRTGVVLDGVEKLVAEAWPLDDDERLVFLDELGQLFDGAPVVPVVVGGRWCHETGERRLRRA